MNLTPKRPERQLLLAGRTPRELAESLGVSEQMLRDWRRQAQLDRGERDDGADQRGARRAAAAAARERPAQAERDLLKRAAAFFAKETETR
jgi:transposase